MQELIENIKIMGIELFCAVLDTWDSNTDISNKDEFIEELNEMCLDNFNISIEDI